MKRVVYMSCDGKDAEDIGRTIKEYCSKRKIDFTHIVERKEQSYLRLARQRIRRKKAAIEKLILAWEIIANFIYRLVLLREESRDASKYNKNAMVTDNVNASEVYEMVRNRRGTLCIVFGTSIICDSMLSEFELGVNIHTSILPSYRGCRSELWALSEGKLGLIGVTLHELTSRLDGGRVIAQKSADSVSKLESVARRNNVENARGLIEDMLETVFEGDGRELWKFHGPYTVESYRGMPKTKTYLNYMGRSLVELRKSKWVERTTQVLYGLTIVSIALFIYSKREQIGQIRVVNPSMLAIGVAMQVVFTLSQFVIWRWAFIDYKPGWKKLWYGIVPSFYLYSLGNVLNYLPGKVTGIVALASSAKGIGERGVSTIRTVIVLQIYSLVVSAYIVGVILLVGGIKGVVVGISVALIGVMTTERFQKANVDMRIVVSKHLRAMTAFLMGWVLMITTFISYLEGFGFRFSVDEKETLGVSYLVSYAIGQFAFVMPAGVGAFDLSFTEMCRVLGCGVDEVDIILGILVVRLMSVIINATNAALAKLLLSR